MTQYAVLRNETCRYVSRGTYARTPHPHGCGAVSVAGCNIRKAGGVARGCARAASLPPYSHCLLRRRHVVRVVSYSSAPLVCPAVHPQRRAVVTGAVAGRITALWTRRQPADFGHLPSIDTVQPRTRFRSAHPDNANGLQPKSSIARPHHHATAKSLLRLIPDPPLGSSRTSPSHAGSGCRSLPVPVSPPDARN